MSRERVLAALCGFVLLAACGPPASTSTERPTADARSTADAPIAYATRWNEYGVAEGGVNVKKPSDLAKLTGAPTDFVDYIGELLADQMRVADPSAGCDDAAVVGVDGIDARTGVAIGSQWACGDGGWASIWIRRNGRWMEAVGTQMGWSCEELEKFRVPQQIVAPTCEVYGTGKMTQLHYGGPGKMASAGTQGKRMVYMTTLNPDSSGADGVTITTTDDLADLKGAPSRFVDHVEDQLGNGCATMVYAIDPKAGIATGSAIDCERPEDAHQIIWLLWHHTWIDVAMSSGRWPCRDLEQYRVPDDFTGSTCSEWDDNGDENIVGYEGP